MIHEENYKSLERTVNLIIQQALSPENIKVGKQFSANPEKLWNQLKLLLTYRNDPKGIELIQGIDTLLNKNYYGVPGMGDCDCFTCAVLSIAFAHGKPAIIVLAGNKGATHIYPELIAPNGRNYSVDLTNDFFNIRRPYKKNQYIYVSPTRR